MKIKTVMYFSLIGLAKIVENVNIQCWQGVTMFSMIIKNLKIKGLSCSLFLSSNSKPTIDPLCDSEQVTSPYWASISSSVFKKTRTEPKIIKSI